MESNKPVAIVLGGIYPHGALMQKLKNRGYYTILIDYFENPPAAYLADEHIQESAMDSDVVCRIAKERNAELVMSPCLDQQLLIAMEVSEKLGLSCPFDTETALKVTNKKYMKRIMMDNDIPTAKYYRVGKEDDLSQLKLSFPIIVKPVDSCGAAGVTKLDDKDGLTIAVENACSWSRDGEAIVEEFKAGMEVSAYTYVQNNKATLVTTQNRISFLGNNIVKCYGAVSPAEISENVRQKLEDIATKIANVFGLNNTPLFYQAIIGKDEDVSVIEFSPRMGGGTCFFLMESNAKYDMLNSAIDSYLHLDNQRRPSREEKVMLIYQVQAHECIFDHVDGVEELKQQGVITEFFLQKTQGMHVSNEKASSSRIAAIVVAGDTKEKCYEKLNKAVSTITVYDNEGKDVTDRSLVLTETDIAIAEKN